MFLSCVPVHDGPLRQQMWWTNTSSLWAADPMRKRPNLVWRSSDLVGSDPSRAGSFYFKLIYRGESKLLTPKIPIDKYLKVEAFEPPLKTTFTHL
jgi:hypothetical protein